MYRNYSVIDFHSHFLPNMDDGSRSIEESVQMLQDSYHQGVDTMIATPHFYANRNTIPHFLTKRSESYARVQSAVEGLTDIPKLCLGAEVLYFEGMSSARMIRFLCIEQTNILLLEMPFAQWDESVLREIELLQQEQQVRVMIAHLDRYFPYQKNTEYIKKLLTMPVYIQLNADAFTRFRRHDVLKLVRLGRVDALGSDCHNTTRRAPNLESACRVITKKLGPAGLERIDKKSRMLLPRTARQPKGVLQQLTEDAQQYPDSTGAQFAEGAQPCIGA